MRREKNLWKRAVMFVLILVLAAVCYPSREVQAASTKAKALKAYRAFRASEKRKHTYNYYAITDVDGNKIPEMIYAYAPADGSGRPIGKVFTYKKGKVRALTKWHQGISGYAKIPGRKWLVETTSGGYDYHDHTVYKMNSSKTRMKVQAVWKGHGSEYYYRYNRKKISPAAYRKFESSLHYVRLKSF